MITFDFRAFERAARDMRAAADQIPFALAQSLNDAAERARVHLADTVWPAHVTARNKSFLKAALTTRGMRATKRKLSVTLFDKLGRAHLLEHEEGGTKKPRGQAIAIPGRDIAAKRGSRGVPAGLRPRSIPNTFVTDGKRANPKLVQGAIYQRTGTYKAAGTVIGRTGKTRKKTADSRGLKLVYVLKPSVPIKADVPFEAEFDRVMTREVWRAFQPRLSAAIASRRR